MIKKLASWACVLPLFVGVSCTDVDAKRTEELRAMPVLWKSEILVPDPDVPQADTLFPLPDSYDPGLAEHMQGAEKTPNYIPESVVALAPAKVDKTPRKVTIEIGDEVSVLATRASRTKFAFYLIRTKHDTYAWLYAYHLQDNDGDRLAEISDS